MGFIEYNNINLVITTPNIAQKEFFSPDISFTPDMSQK